MWRELRAPSESSNPALVEGEGDGGVEAVHEQPAERKTLRQAIVQIVIADVSMSLDNVLAVAGAARENTVILVFGLALSIVLMGLAATWIARLLERHRWIAYVGLAIILFVALEMIWRGGHEVWAASGAEITENGIELNGVDLGGDEAAAPD